MKYNHFYLFLLIGICACNPITPDKITMEDLKDSSNRNLLVPKESENENDIQFFDTEQKMISPDKFNQLLAEGLFLSEQKKQIDGTEQVHLVSIIDYEKKLEAQTLPPFEIIDLSGKTHNAHSIKGKITIMSFWQVASKLCTQEIENLNALALEYSKDKKILWLALAIDKPLDLSKFLKLDHWHYTFAADQEILAHNLGIKTYPVHLIINEKGKIIKAIVRNSDSVEIIEHSLAKLVK